MRKVKKKIITLLLLFLISVLVFLTATAISIWRYGKVDEKQKSDVAIVLGAGTDNGDPSPVFRERINHGIWLYENGYADYLIFTGGLGDGEVLSDSYVAKEYAVSKGVPKEVIFIEEESTTTEENLFQAKRIMESNSLNTAIIVSDPLHMMRSMLISKDLGIESVSSPTPTTMYKSVKTKLSFLFREEFFYVTYIFFG